MGTTERVGDEALLREIRTVQVAQGHAWAADVELAGQAGGNGVAQRAQHAHVGPVDGAAQRHGGVAVQIVFGHRPRDGEGGGLGGAVTVDQLQSGQRLQCPAHMTGRQRLAPGHQRAQTLQVQRVLVNDAIEECGRQPCGVDAFGADGLGQTGPGGDGLRMDDTGAAIEQWSPDLQRRGIKGQRCCVQHHHLGAQRRVILAVDQPDDGPMGDDHALGGACGTGGVHHVGGLPGRAAVSCQILLGDPFRQAGNRVESHERIGVAAVAVEAVDVQCRNAARLGQRQLVGLGVRIHQQQRGLAVFQHQRQPLFRTGRVDGYIDGAQAQDAQHQGDGFGPARQQHGHVVAGTHVQRLQAGGVAQRDLAQGLVVPGDAGRAGHAHRRGIGVAAALQVEALDDGGLRQACVPVGGTGPGLKHQRLDAGGQIGELAQRLRALQHQLDQQVAQQPPPSMQRHGIVAAAGRADGYVFADKMQRNVSLFTGRRRFGIGRDGIMPNRHGVHGVGIGRQHGRLGLLDEQRQPGLAFPGVASVVHVLARECQQAGGVAQPAGQRAAADAVVSQYPGGQPGDTPRFVLPLARCQGRGQFGGKLDRDGSHRCENPVG